MVGNMPGLEKTGFAEESLSHGMTGFKNFLTLIIYTQANNTHSFICKFYIPDKSILAKWMLSNLIRLQTLHGLNTPKSK